MKSFFIENNDNVYLPESDFNRLGDHSIKVGDVLISVVGTLGNSCIVTESDTPAIFSCKSTIIRKPEVNPYYLVSYLNSEPGKSLLLRCARGSVQLGLNLPDLRQYSVPVFSHALQVTNEQLIKAAYKSFEIANEHLTNAEQSLLRTLGVENWLPSKPLTYTRPSTEAFAVGRLDAEYFRPRVHELLAILGGDGHSIGDLAPARSERFIPASSGSFEYLEIGGLRMDGTAQAESVLHKEAPSRATSHVHSGDVITSTVRPIRRLSALIAPEQDGFVCSSGFVVLQPKHVAPEVLLTYLRLPVVCELMDLHTSASLYPAISEQDLLSLPMPLIDATTSDAICAAVKSSQASRQRAAELLEAAKRAVEIAIEDSEAAALNYLNEIIQGAGGH
ncbi:hypothetical protein [Dechloromonas denitrificans]|uniref:hypothetical protein n=1 Tax=Dechloromonas denitrificans TaxID=281362 RepID=UPI000AD6888B|nr:hypothetical protein [Dechloromonas denitrificans]